MIISCTYCKSNTKNLLYCSVQCQADHKKQIIVENWKNGLDPGYISGFVLKKAIRRYLLEKSNYSCSLCGWNKINIVTGKSPLEIDHIDGNSKNCLESNLRVICPNCHSLTATYKALNKGFGRTILLSP